MIIVSDPEVIYDRHFRPQADILKSPGDPQGGDLMGLQAHQVPPLDSYLSLGGVVSERVAGSCEFSESSLRGDYVSSFFDLSTSSDLLKGDSSMIGLVVVCHEDMGAELVKAAEMIVGKIAAVATVSVKQESAPELLRDEIQAAIKKVDRKNGVMLLTDMFGGTPSNIALAFLGETIEVVTGVNLSMLIKFANHRDEKPLPDLAKLVQEAAQKSIVIASQILKGKK